MIPTPQDVAAKLIPNVILHGPLLTEPIKVLAAAPLGTSYKIIGQGLKTNQVHQPILEFLHLHM